MEQHFKLLKEKYDYFEKFLLGNGRLLAMDTEIGYWGVTPLTEAFHAFKKIELHKNKKFVDLGSGDGRITLLASLFGVKAVGIEAFPWLIETSHKMKSSMKHPVFQNVEFKEEDFMEHDIRDYDVVYVSPDKPFYHGLERKLKNELTGKLVVHGWEFHPRSLKKLDEHIINGEKFSIYENNKV